MNLNIEIKEHQYGYNYIINEHVVRTSSQRYKYGIVSFNVDTCKFHIHFMCDSYNEASEFYDKSEDIFPDRVLHLCKMPCTKRVSVISVNMDKRLKELLHVAQAFDEMRIRAHRAGLTPSEMHKAIGNLIKRHE